MRKVRSERNTISNTIRCTARCTASEVFYVPSTKHEAALGRRLYGIHTSKGIVTLTGEIGRGDFSINVLCRRDNNGAWVMS